MLMRKIGILRAIYRYPVKSMAGELLISAALGWHGIDGDRRFALVRKAGSGGYPWLIASKLPALVTYKAYYHSSGGSSSKDVTVTTPSGTSLTLDRPELHAEITEQFGSPVEPVRLENGIFDDAPISLITTATIAAMEHDTGRNLDVRRFRPNLLIGQDEGEQWGEDSWKGKSIIIGNAPDAPALLVTTDDLRCTMVNIDPETAATDPLILKTIVTTRNNCAGVYGTILRCGTIRTGDSVYIEERP
jgi:uncharacterized protein